MIIRTLKTFLILLFLQTSLLANTQYFKEGVKLFNENNLIKAKFKFEQDIVFNPKSELSYLYLSKIFKSLNKKNLEEQNLNTVILLNPKNEEAIYSLAKLKLEVSDYNKSRELNETLIKLCKDFCSKGQKLKIEIEKLSKK